MTESSKSAQLSTRARRKYRRRRVGLFVARTAGSWLLRAYSALWRKRMVMSSDAAKEALDNGCLGVLWHGRGMSLLPLFRGSQAAILVSPSPDGRMMTEVLEAWGFQVVTGSSRHNAAKALRELLGILDQGHNICVTPDGPPGPEHTVSGGIAFLSRATGRPVVPIGIGVSRAWRLSTYDRYTIPKPFSRVVGHVGEPIQVPREAKSEAEQAEWAEVIHRAIVQAEKDAFADLGLEHDP